MKTTYSSTRALLCCLLLVGLVLFAFALPARATQTDIAGPAGSGAFGSTVTVLPNGNIVVTDPLYDAPGPVADVGAVYLLDGATLAVISTRTGSTAGDQSDPTWTALPSFTTSDNGAERTAIDLAAGAGPKFYVVEIVLP